MSHQGRFISNCALPVVLALGLLSGVRSELVCQAVVYGTWPIGGGQTLEFFTSDAQLRDRPVLGRTTALGYLEANGAYSHPCNGNLRCLSHGLDLQTANGDVIPGSTPFPTAESAGQGVLMLPYPGHLDSFLVITAPRRTLGGVVERPPDSSWYSYIVVHDPQDGSASPTAYPPVRLPGVSPGNEMLAATHDRYGGGFWFVTLQPAETGALIYAFHVDQNGVADVPVVSQIDPSIGRLTQCQADFSADGSKLIIGGFNAYYQVFDFDTRSGRAAYRFKLWKSDLALLKSRQFTAHGVRFALSASGRWLYTTLLNRSEPDGKAAIIQIDLLAADPIASTRMVAEYSLSGVFDLITLGLSLRLAPDNRIYITEPYGIGVINNPESQAPSCDLQRGFFRISTPYLTFPSTINSMYVRQSMFICSGFSVRDDSISVCEGDVIRIVGESDLGTSGRVTWRTDDGITRIQPSGNEFIGIGDLPGSHSVIAYVDDSPADTVIVVVVPRARVELTTSVAVLGKPFRLSARALPAQDIQFDIRYPGSQVLIEEIVSGVLVSHGLSDGHDTLIVSTVAGQSLGLHGMILLNRSDSFYVHVKTLAMECGGIDTILRLTPDVCAYPYRLVQFAQQDVALYVDRRQNLRIEGVLPGWTVRIVDVAGSIVMSRVLQSPVNEYDVSMLPPGLYAVNVMDNRGDLVTTTIQLLTDRP